MLHRMGMGSMHALKSRVFTALLQLDFHTLHIRSEAANAGALLTLKSFADVIIQLPRYLKCSTSLISPSLTLNGA